MRLVALCVLVLAAAGCRKPASLPAPVVEAGSRRTTASGEVVGFVGRYDSYVWLGLPYAAPPTGDGRWRAPHPPQPWTGVREALAAGAPCMQYASPLGIQTAAVNTPVGSEDCLYANVYAPRTATPASRLPVMVWIHGGGNSVGAGHLYDGGHLAATRDVVVVTLNYRLGPFGWMRHAALRAEATSDAERSGNFALLDLVRALEWVRDGITAFGGDPTRVTVFGESAGATNTLALLLAPQARGLFHRAAVQSGGMRVSDPDTAERFDAGAAMPEVANASNEALARLMVHIRRARDRADAKAQLTAMPAADLAALARGANAADLLRAYAPTPSLGMIQMPMVFLDGAVLPSEAPVERFRAGSWNRVPVIIGTNRDENKLFMFGSPQWVRRWFWLIPRLRDPERYDAVAEHLSKMWKATGADEIATAMQAGGATDVFVYRFDWDEEPTVVGADLGRMLGACHGFEIPFVFDHFEPGREANILFTAENEAGRRALSAAMGSYWTELAVRGAPGRGRSAELPAWPAWSAAPSFLVFDTPAGGGVRPSPETLTREAVLAAVETDPRLAAPRDRCIAYHDLLAWAGSITRAAYDAKCPAFPFDGYPWD